MHCSQGIKLTFRTTWTKSFEFCGVRPCIWRVQASSEEAWATIRTVFPVWNGGGRAACCEWHSLSTPFLETQLKCSLKVAYYCAITNTVRNTKKIHTLRSFNSGFTTRKFKKEFTKVFALCQDLSRYLEAPADVSLVGLRYSQLIHRKMRSWEEKWINYDAAKQANEQNNIFLFLIFVLYL